MQGWPGCMHYLPRQAITLELVSQLVNTYMNAESDGSKVQGYKSTIKNLSHWGNGPKAIVLEDERIQICTLYLVVALFEAFNEI